MPSYPSSLQQSVDSREEWVDPAIVSYTRAGGVKARRLQAARKRVFHVEHKFLTASQVGTLLTFYDANRASSFDFAWNDSPGATYSVIFANDRSLEFRRAAGNYYDVTVELAEV